MFRPQHHVHHARLLQVHAHVQQVRRELLANIAHDMATPLTAIQGLSEAIADDIIIDPPARQETAQRIGREVQRLRRDLLRRLLR